MGLLWFSFKLIIIVLLEKYANFIQRQRATDYKAQGSDWGGGGGGDKYCVIVWKSWQHLHLFHCHPDSNLHWMDLQCMPERSVRPWIRWHQRPYSCVVIWSSFSEFASIVEWSGSHQWAIPWISVQSLCVWQCSNVAHPKTKYLAKFCDCCSPVMVLMRLLDFIKVLVNGPFTRVKLLCFPSSLLGTCLRHRYFYNFCVYIHTRTHWLWCSAPGGSTNSTALTPNHQLVTGPAAVHFKATCTPHEKGAIQW